MPVRPLEYFEPNFLDEALVVLERFAGEARALAGGTRLVPELRAHPGGVAAIVNLKRIADLHDIEASGDALSIGALATVARLVTDRAVSAGAPLLARAASTMGAPQLRSIATIGGSICSGDPASDLTAALLALDADVCIATLGSGERRVALADALTVGGTTLGSGELLTRIVIPIRPAAIAYRKMQTRRGFEMALVAAAVSLRREGGRIQRVRIALAGAASTCLRAVHAENAAMAAPDLTAAAEEAGKAAAELDAKPHDDLRAHADYRRHLARILTRRAIVDATSERA